MSSNKPFFTVVIYLNNESAEVTFDSIIGDKAYTDGDVQIIMVRSTEFDCSAFIDSRLNKELPVLVEKDAYATEAKAYAAAMKNAQGRYVSFMQCGAAYRNNALAFAKTYLEKNGCSFSSLMCNADGTNLVETEIDRCFRAKPSVCDLNEKYTVPFIFLTNCFFSTDMPVEDVSAAVRKQLQ